MQKELIEVPAMYGDHHVIEVRRILLALPGVKEVNASSCFQTVEATYDPNQISLAEIKAKLDEAGYLDALPAPVETGTAAAAMKKQAQETFFRHTTAYAQTNHTVSFAQDINYPDRPLWPCPGMGVIDNTQLETVKLRRETNHA